MENNVEAGKWCPLIPLCAKVTSGTEAAGVFLKEKSVSKCNFFYEWGEWNNDHIWKN